MAEVLRSFPDWLVGRDGQRYRARACGRARADGRWEAWIEFVSADGRVVRRSRRETVQPNRGDLEYWASGLSSIYLDGSLERTLEPRLRPPMVPPPAPPAFDGPAPERGDRGAPAEIRPVTLEEEPFGEDAGFAGDDSNDRELDEGSDPVATSSLMTRLLRMDEDALRMLLRRCDLVRPGEDPDGLDRREIALRLLMAARQDDLDSN